MADTTGWLSKGETAALIGVSEKTVERMAASGELEAGWRKAPGAKPRRVYDPATVEKARAALVASIGGADITSDLITTTEAHGGTVAIRQGSPLDTLTQALREALRPTTAQTVPIENKLYLTIAEARAYTGLKGYVITDAAAAGVVRTIQNGRGKSPSMVYRRDDLAKIGE